MSRFAVRVSGREIGRSDLENVDESMGIAHGRFYPTPEYESVATVFALFAQAQADNAKLAAYYVARDALKMELVDAVSGSPLPASTIHIADHRNEVGDEEAIELDVWIDARALRA